MSTTEAAREPEVRFGGVNPVFQVDFREGDGFASVSRGNVALFLCVGDQGHPGT